MEKLTSIWERNNEGEKNSKEDLRFLYEFDGKIEGFGYNDDPRIKEILEKRDAKTDLSEITGFPKKQISVTDEEALQGDIKYHHGNLDLRGLTSAEGLKLPESIGGYLDLRGLTSAQKNILKAKYPNLRID